MGQPGEAQPVPAAFAPEIRAWIASVAGEAGRSPHTAAAYRRDLEKAARLLHAAGRAAWQEVTAEDLAGVLAAARRQGAAPASQARLLASLRGFYRFLQAEGRGPEQDPTRFAGRVRLWRRLPEVLSPEEARALLDAPPAEDWKGQRDRALLALLYGGGLRVSEACGLHLGDLSLRAGARPEEPGLIRILGKGGRERLVPFGGLARERVETWLREGRPTRTARTAERPPWVLLSRSGRALDRHRAWSLVREHARRAGIRRPLHPHILRHSCATHLLAGGGDLRSVQEFLGHADLRTTERYTHVEVDELRALHRLHHPRARRPQGRPEGPPGSI